jgi:hypothetical protein
MKVLKHPSYFWLQHQQRNLANFQKNCRNLVTRNHRNTFGSQFGKASIEKSGKFSKIIAEKFGD